MSFSVISSLDYVIIVMAIYIYVGRSVICKVLKSNEVYNNTLLDSATCMHVHKTIYKLQDDNILWQLYVS